MLHFKDFVFHQLILIVVLILVQCTSLLYSRSIPVNDDWPYIPFEYSFDLSLNPNILLVFIETWSFPRNSKSVSSFESNQLCWAPVVLNICLHVNILTIFARTLQGNTSTWNKLHWQLFAFVRIRTLYLPSCWAVDVWPLLEVGDGGHHPVVDLSQGQPLLWGALYGL